MGKKFFLSIFLVALSGAFFGVHETVNYHYSDFKAAFPRANDGFWNPEISWRNKYKSGDVSKGSAFTGSTTFLVFLTDAKHLSWTIHFLLLVLGCGLFLNEAMKRYGATVSNIFIYIVCVLLIWVCHGLFFEFVYNILF